MAHPLLVSLALGSQTAEVLETASALARGLRAPLGVVHALSWAPFESADRRAARTDAVHRRLVELLKEVQSSGIEVLDPIVRVGSPSDLVVETASELDAQMIVTGGGGSETVRRWLLGSVAESVVRSASLPVFVVRGRLDSAGLPVVCPVDLSPHAHEGFREAVRLARSLARPLLTVTVVPPERGTQGGAARPHLDASEARDQVVLLAQSIDLDGIEVEHRVVVADDAAAAIVEASQGAALLVMATRSFLEIASTGMGAFTERVLRSSVCSTVVLRVPNTGEVTDEEAIRRLGRIKTLAEQHLEGNEPGRALPLLELLVRRAGTHPSAHERLADALDALGRESEAEAQRTLARLLRAHLG